MFNKSKAISLGLINLGLLLLVIFIMLDLTGVDSEASGCDPFENLGLSKEGFCNLGVAGATKGTKTHTPPAVVVDGDTVYMFWKGTGDYNDIYYTYYPANTANGWSELVKIGQGITSNWGVDAVLFTPDANMPDTKKLCLFLRSGGLDENKLRYTCTKQYQKGTQSTAPQFSWGPIWDMPNLPGFTKTYYNALVDIQKKEGDDSSFYFISTQNVKECAPQNDPESCQDDFDLWLRRATDSKSENNTLIFEDVSHRVGSFHQSTLLLMSDSSDYQYFAFFFDNSDLSSEEKFHKISYVGLKECGVGVYYNDDCFKEPPKVHLLDNQTKTRDTNNPSSVYRFKDNIYVAYKNLNNEKIRFSKISLEDWNKLTDEHGDPAYNGIHGAKRWIGCEYYDTDYDWDAARSVTAPTLFEYHDKLYLAYANAANDNRITYHRIDNINIHHYDSNNNLNCYKES